MPKADTDHITAGPALPPSRRGLLAAAASALVAGAAIATAAHGAPVASPGLAGADAELLALYRSFLAEHATVTAWNAGRVPEEIGEAAHDRWWACVDALLEIPAHTPAGLAAKAAVALCAVNDVEDPRNGADELARVVLAEIAGSAAA